MCRFNRRRVRETEEHIEVVWNERVCKEPWLFNGAKFRLHSAELTVTPPRTSASSYTKAAAPNHISLHCSEEEHASLAEIHASAARSEKISCCREPQKDANGVILRLQLGLTCYKDFLGTNWSHEAGNLQQRGRMEVGDPQALLAQPLGVGAVLVTSDGQVVMLRRSQRVAEAAGLLDIPGGHPEPKVI